MSVCLSVFSSVHMFQRGSRRKDLDENFTLRTSMKICRGIPNFFKLCKISRSLHEDLMWVFMCCRIHKIDINGIRPSGYPRVYKHFANAPQCYVTRTLPTLLLYKILRVLLVWYIIFFAVVIVCVNTLILFNLSVTRNLK